MNRAATFSPSTTIKRPAATIDARTVGEAFTVHDTSHCQTLPMAADH